MIDYNLHIIWVIIIKLYWNLITIATLAESVPVIMVLCLYRLH